VTGVEKAQQILTLARSRQAADRERLMLSIADLCEAARPAGERLDPGVEILVNGIFRDLIVGAEREIRKALAERLAGADWAPHDLVTLICTDDIDVARPLIAESSVLTDQDLMRLLRQAAIEHQIEVARRPGISEAVVEMILDQGQPAVLTALADNDTAAISDDGLSRLVDASREVAALRSPLVRHPRLTVELAERLYAWVGESLRQAVVSRFRVDPHAFDSALNCAVATAQTEAHRTGIVLVQEEERRKMERQLVVKLKDAGQLKPGYLIRALREQRLSLFMAALAELAAVNIDAIELAIKSDRPELLALACTAAGVDRSAFSTLLALVRQLSDGHPITSAASGKRAMNAFTVSDPQVAAAAFRQALAHA
jgi:uncharacterized protein (DUF2336 family)